VVRQQFWQYARYRQRINQFSKLFSHFSFHSSPNQQQRHGNAD
jgi:hypothetical protein